MNSRFPNFPVLLAALALGAASASAASSVKSDFATPEARQVVVVLANRLAQPAEITPVSDDLKSLTPFTPPGFDRPDPREKSGLPAPSAGGVTGPAKLANTRDTLDLIASRLRPTGVIIGGGTPFLVFKTADGRQKMLKVGDKVTITFEGSDYDLEISSITSTDFTLTLNNQKITRPIKSGKTK